MSKHVSPLLDDRPLAFQLGWQLPEKHAPFLVTETDLDRHALIAGTTGSGKSFLVRHLTRLFMQSFRGFLVIDPAGDLCEDILADASTRHPAILHRIHYLFPGEGYKTAFGYDPLRFRPGPEVEDLHLQAAYQSFRHANADRVSELFQRVAMGGDTSLEGMPRLKRVLSNVLIACGTVIAGKHLPLALAAVLIDVHHPRHPDIYHRVEPFLPRDVRGDFAYLHSCKRMEDLRRETESTLNRLRALLSPVTRGIFSEQDCVFSMRDAIRHGGIVLANLKETDYFSFAQAQALGSLLIWDTLSSARREERASRRPYYLIIDEAADFIGPDVLRALKQTRKHKLSVLLLGQDLSSFQKKDFDMRKGVLTQCKLQMTFQQSDEEDLVQLSRAMAYGNIDFTELMEVKDRPDGQDWMQVRDTGGSTTEQQNWSQTHTDGGGSTDTHAIADGVAHATGKIETHSKNETRGKADAKSKLEYGTRPATISHSDNSSAGSGSAQGRSDVTTVNKVVTNSTAESQNWSDADTEGGARSEGSSWSNRWVIVPRTREEWHHTGKLRQSVEDQFHRIMQGIQSLKKRQLFVKMPEGDTAFAAETVFVQEPYPNPRDKLGVVEEMKRRLFAVHPYFFRPDVSERGEDRLIAEFLGTRRAEEPDGKRHDTLPPVHRNGTAKGSEEEIPFT